MRCMTSSGMKPSLHSSTMRRRWALEHLALQALVGPRAVLVPAVVPVVEAGGEAPATVLQQPAQPLGGLVADPFLGHELVHAGDRRLGRLHPRLVLLALALAVVLDGEQADDEREREALRDERDEDRGERAEDDEVAAREGRAGVRRQRDRQRGRQGDRPAHPHPGQDGRVLPRRVRVVRADAAEERAGEVGERGDPHDAGGHDHQRDEQPLAHEGEVGVGRHRRELEPDEDEQPAVDDEDEDLPRGVELQARARRGELGGAPAEPQPRGHGGEDVGDPERLGGHAGDPPRPRRAGPRARRARGRPGQARRARRRRPAARRPRPRCAGRRPRPRFSHPT